MGKTEAEPGASNTATARSKAFTKDWSGRLATTYLVGLTLFMGSLAVAIPILVAPTVTFAQWAFATSAAGLAISSGATAHWANAARKNMERSLNPGVYRSRGR